MNEAGKSFQTLLTEVLTKAYGFGDFPVDITSEDRFFKTFIPGVLDSLSNGSSDQQKSFIHAQMVLLKIEAHRKHIPLEQYCTGAFLRWFSVRVTEKDLFSPNENNAEAISTIVALLELLQNEHLIHLKTWQECAVQLVLPLRLIHKLDKAQLLSFDSYFAKSVENPGILNAILDQLINLGVSNLAQNAPIFQMCLTTLMFGSFNTEIPTRHCRNVSSEILKRVVAKLWEEAWSVNETIPSFDWLRGANIETELDVQYAKRCLEVICCSGVQMFTPKDAVAQQANWTFAVTHCNVSAFIQTLLKPLTSEEVMQVLKTVLEKGQVNWKSFLTVISTCLVTNVQVSASFQGLVTLLVNHGIEGHEDSLLTALLIVRQGAAENHYSFPSYKRWFCSTFGEASKTVCNTASSFLTLLHVLTSLVPVETQEILTIHVCNPPVAPKECRDDLNDYLTLARTRLSDLGINLRSHREIDKDSVAVKSDVANAIASFIKTNKIPNNVLEMSFFRKPYFVDWFLPVLLRQRSLSENSEVDGRMAFIEALRAAGKLPQQKYDQFMRTSEEPQNLVENVIEIDGDIEADIESEILSVIESLRKAVGGDSGSAVQTVHFGALLVSKLSSFLETPDSTNVPLSLCLYESNSDVWPADKVAEAMVKLIHSWSDTFVTTTRTMMVVVSSLKLFPKLQKVLYEVLHDVFKKRGTGVSLPMLAKWMFCLECQRDNLLPVEVPISKSAVPFVDFLLQEFGIRTSDEMEFIYKLACLTFHEWVLNVKPISEAYLDENGFLARLWKIYAWIQQRLRFSMSRVEEKWVKGLPDFQSSAFDSFNKITLPDWLGMEMNVVPCQDVLKPTERQLYLHRYFVSNFLSTGSTVLEGISVIYHPVLALFHLIVLERLKSFSKTWPPLSNDQDCSQTFVLLLQLVLNRSIPGETQDTAWLPTYWLSLHNRDNGLRYPSETIDLVVWSIVQWLPPHLLVFSSNSAKTTPSEKSLDILSDLINDYWKDNLTKGAFLPLNLVAHLALGFEETGHVSLEQDWSLLRAFVERTGSFKASFQVHFERLSQLLKHIIGWENLFAESGIMWQRWSLKQSNAITMSSDAAINRSLVVSVLVQVTAGVLQGSVDLPNLNDSSKDVSSEVSNGLEVLRGLLKAYQACPNVIEAFDPRFWKKSRIAAQIPSVIFELLPYTSLFVLVSMAEAHLAHTAVLPLSSMLSFVEALLLVCVAWTRQSGELFQHAEHRGSNQAWQLADYRMLGMLKKSLNNFLRDGCPKPLLLRVNRDIVAMLDDELRMLFTP